MKLLTGSTGMIGRNLKELLPPMLCPTHDELDLTDRDKVKNYLRANKPEAIIHCGSNDDEICLYDNLRMFMNLAESEIPMITFCTGREIEDRSYKNGEYVFSKHLIKELALTKYSHILVIQLWGCFGKYERPIRFLASNIARIQQGLPIVVGENKLFSYVYVKDLADIVEGLKIHEFDEHPKILFQVVAYTAPLLVYAKMLKRVSGFTGDIIVEKENFFHSYAGYSNFFYKYTELEDAIADYWGEMNGKKA